ncbi:ty1-copia retrotransposon protein [Cucumis melo var. makuwa]|uniref:Ty1-copia retrotransposon protein n=1 Tax=Cucumis melo var. makuwa TaxID=1194695 RepID=A0A5D3CK88_CUCMM|nr:ty1-copia retrotransposon protein [Cucumis melo var. makuwa]TYK11574.1 ty1-copia retrotransposon protein [Cucumis melo var. makuwa]
MVETKLKSTKPNNINLTLQNFKKKKLVCYIRRKEGHKSYQCNQRKGRPNQKPTPQANLAEQDDEVIVAIVEVNLIEDRLFGFSILESQDTSAPIENFSITMKILQMENAYSWGTQPLNLVPKSLLNRAGLKILLEGDKVVFTKNKEFVGKVYLSNGLFVLNIVSKNANVSSFAYIVESVNLWDGRLGHVNFASFKKLEDLRLINTSESHETGKCPVYVENKDLKTYQEALNSVESSM